MTGISYPNSWNAGQSESCAIENIDASVIEFACGELDFNPNDYVLEKIEIIEVDNEN